MTQTCVMVKLLVDRRKLRLFLLLPLESGCWGGRLLCHQKHLGSYANVQICFHFSPLSSPTYLLTAHFCLCGCYLTHFSFSFTHHFLALQSFFFCLPHTGDGNAKEEIRIRTQLCSRGNVIQLLSLKLARTCPLSWRRPLQL